MGGADGGRGKGTDEEEWGLGTPQVSGRTCMHVPWCTECDLYEQCSHCILMWVFGVSLCIVRCCSSQSAVFLVPQQPFRRRLEYV